MALFRCTYSQGSGGYTLTVTTDSALSGATVTATDGTTTLTSTFTSSSPYTAEFSIPNGGTWTITSGTASQTVNVPSSIEIHNIPTGSSATPTDNIQIWLHCANIWDKNYTTISAVLADTTTLLALISSNNAVDYMARSTTWASSVCANSTAMTYIGANNYCADTLLADSDWCEAICNSTYFESVLNVKVPTMTSNTAPSGVASGLNYEQKEPWIAFSGIADSTHYFAPSRTNTASTLCYLQYQFTSAKKVAKIKFQISLYIGVSTYPGAHIYLQGSNDGTTFTDVYDLGTVSGTAGDEKVYTFTNNTAYTYYRLSNKGSSIWRYTDLSLQLVQFYGRS